MPDRTTPRAITATTLAAGILCGIVGLITDHNHMSRAGVIIAVAAVPFLVRSQVHRAARDIDERLAAAHHAGYVLALQHVACGLLDAPRHPGPGAPHHIANVPHLPRQTAGESFDRKAQ